MSQEYRVSKALVKYLSREELEALCADVKAVDLGWWTRFHGIDTMSEDELRRLMKLSDEELRREWRTELYASKKADLLYWYANGFFEGTRDLLNCYLAKRCPSDTEALPILFLFCQFAELALKASIEYMVAYREMLGTPVVEPDLNTHDLNTLLTSLATLFEAGEPFLSEETQEFIRKIYDINELAQGFRYPFTDQKGKKTGKVFLVDAPLVPMNMFKVEFEMHGGELHGFMIWLGHGYIYLQEDPTDDLVDDARQKSFSEI